MLILDCLVFLAANGSYNDFLIPPMEPSKNMALAMSLTVAFICFFGFLVYKLVLLGSSIASGHFQQKFPKPGKIA